MVQEKDMKTIQSQVVDTVTNFRLKKGGIWVRFPLSARKLALIDNAETDSGATIGQDSCPVGIGSYFPGLKRPACEAEQSSVSNSEVKNAWNYISTPHTP
jgi:hypothetical protein